MATLFKMVSLSTNVRRSLRFTPVAVAVLLVTIAISVLTRDVVRQIEAMQTASSDNVQWTLSRLEVELHHYEAALIETIYIFPADEKMQSVQQIRQAFDIFYSRFRTIDVGPAYAHLQDSADFKTALDDIRTSLDNAIPTIDGEDLALLAATPMLLSEAERLHVMARRLSLNGLRQFAAQTDQRREEVSTTLIRLALLAGLMVLALSASLVILLREFRRRDRRMQANRAIAERMNTIISSSLNAVLMMDRDGNVLEFNGAAEKIFGYSAAEAVGKKMSSLIIPPEYREAHEIGFRHYLQTGKRKLIGEGGIEITAQRKDGSIFPVELSLAVADEFHNATFISFIRDITTRKHAERQLVESRDKALAGEKAKSDFMAVMSHEMRTPLNGLLGTMSLLRDTPLTHRQMTLIENMETSGHLLLHHVNDVLDIAKYDAGKIATIHEPFRLDWLIKEIIDGNQGIATANGNTLSNRWDGPVVDWVVGDSTKLRQILLNLVSNAIKFTRGGQIVVEVAGFTPDGNTPDDRPSFEFRVIDSGIGISEENLTRIFDDFETLDSTYARQATGTGLGLGIARRMTRVMGGEIGVESEPGEGSLFWVRLPLDRIAAPQGTQMTSETPTVPTPARALDVLIVEDNVINRQVLKGMLEAAGHLTTEAEDGRIGVARAEDHRFDVILMDISMPVMDGTKATMAIRAGSGASKDAPIIAVTAHALPNEVAAFHAAGMNDYLTKPIDRRLLLQKLGAQGIAGGPEPAPEEAGFDLPRIQELMDTLGHEPVNGLISRFIAQTDEELVHLMPNSGTALPLAERSAIAHKIAGAAGTLGATGLHKHLSQMQTAAKAGDMQAFEDALPQLHALWATTRRRFTELAATPGNT